MFKKYKIEIIIFALAIVLRLATAFIIYSHSDFNYDNFLGNIKNDGYYEIAQNLINNEVFSYDTVEPILPDTKRTIGYPIIIIPFLYIFNSIWLFLFFQIIIGSLLPLLGRKISIEMTQNKKISNLVAFLLIIEPIGIWLSVKLLTETFFTFFFFLFILFIFKFIKSIKKNTSKLNNELIYIIGASVFLGIATLIKPTTYYFPIVLIFSWLVYRILTKQKILLKYVFIFLFTFFLIMSPWLYRNYKTFETTSLSSASQDALFCYLAPSILAIKNNQNFSKVQSNFFELHGFDNYPRITLANASWFQSQAINVLKNNPKELIQISGISIITFFTHDGVLNLLGSLGIVKFTGLTLKTIINQPLSEMFNTLQQLMLSSTFFIILARVLWFMIFLIFFVSAGWMFIKKKMTALSVFALICVAYFALTTIANGFGVNARFRFPVNVFIFIFVINFLYNIMFPKIHKLYINITN